jgi:L-alanine-DL-glutamate epimerase-like enolase superfamily enzyme
MSSRKFAFKVDEQVWPLQKPFRISRGLRTEAHVIVVTVSDDEHTGRAEAVPIKRYGENVPSATAQLEQFRSNGGLDREQIQDLLPPGAARNALDCALWDWEAKAAGVRAWNLANIRVTDAAETAFTISLDTPQNMAAAVDANGETPMLKLKLGGDDLDLSRVEAVRKAAPAARLLVDANESWSPSHYRNIVPALHRLGVELIEQPFPADADIVLETLDHPIPVCADESCHTTADLPRLASRYEAINIKLDKTGGFTEALRLTESARQHGFKILLGCMVCTSLGIAPSRLLASAADYLDLDGPLLLKADREHGLKYEHGIIGLPSVDLWG